MDVFTKRNMDQLKDYEGSKAGIIKEARKQYKQLLKDRRKKTSIFKSFI